MSEHSSIAEHADVAHDAATETSPLFDRAEISQFGADDGEAVGTIGKMLTGFFLYSFVAMLLVVLATWATSHDEPVPDESHESAEG